MAVYFNLVLYSFFFCRSLFVVDTQQLSAMSCSRRFLFIQNSVSTWFYFGFVLLQAYNLYNDCRFWTVYEYYV